MIHDLYEIQSDIHLFLGPETQQQLIRKVYSCSSSVNFPRKANTSFCCWSYRSELSDSLAALSSSSSALPTQIPHEIIDYVEDGRNPDIYTREFVELAQRGNQYLRSKCEAFARFSEILGDEIVKAMPELKEEVALRLEGKVEPGPRKENGDVKES